MAKQGRVILKGTIQGLCFYEMHGKGYVRTSNPLSRERVKTAPEFAGTRRYADYLKTASPVASALYKTLPKDKRQPAQRYALTGLGITLLKAGKTVTEMEALLAQETEQMREALEPRLRLKHSLVKVGKGVNRKPLNRKMRKKQPAGLHAPDDLISYPYRHPGFIHKVLSGRVRVQLRL